MKQYFRCVNCGTVEMMSKCYATIVSEEPTEFCCCKECFDDQSGGEQ
jgi:hypothetical protein